MKFESFSRTQMEALTWWSDASPHRDMDAVICDGAVRSGKTLCMGISFICWAMRRFDSQKLGMCGRTIISLRRNVLDVVLPVMRDLGFDCTEKVSQNLFTVSFGGRTNTFHLFGGADSGSAGQIQGITFAGVLLDEAALMRREFVEQACARCSVEGSKLWFNCNPDSPEHWFYKAWICKAEEKRALYLKFYLQDNPGLSREIIARYMGMFDGAFYRRFILGEWVSAEGRVYDFFDESFLSDVPDVDFADFAVSCDYGTLNPASFGLWGLYDGIWYRIEEYYYDARKSGRQKTDAEYVLDLLDLIGGRPVRCVVVDPSAASFIEALCREGLPVRKAKNDVLAGIRLTAGLIRAKRLVICRGCEASIREFSLYVWDEGSEGRDAPVKRNDHAMDEIRYFAATVVSEPESEFAATWIER